MLDVEGKIDRTFDTSHSPDQQFMISGYSYNIVPKLKILFFNQIKNKRFWPPEIIALISIKAPTT